MLNSKIIKKESFLKTPNNTTDVLKKAWIIEDGIRYLLKGGYKNKYYNHLMKCLLVK